MQDTQSMQALKWREKTLHVDGLDCASCARELQEVICRLDNVGECSLTYATGKLHLRYQGSLIKLRIWLRPTVINCGKVMKKKKAMRAAQRVKQAAWAALFLLLAVVASAFYQRQYLFLLVTIIVGGQIPFAVLGRLFTAAVRYECFNDYGSYRRHYYRRMVGRFSCSISFCCQ